MNHGLYSCRKFLNAPSLLDWAIWNLSKWNVGETQIKNAKVDKHTTPHNMHSLKADSGHAHIPKFKSFWEVNYALVHATARLRFEKGRKSIWRTHRRKGPGREQDSYWGPLQRADIIPTVLSGSVCPTNFARDHYLLVLDSSTYSTQEIKGFFNIFSV